MRGNKSHPELLDILYKLRSIERQVLVFLEAQVKNSGNVVYLHKDLASHHIIKDVMIALKRQGLVKYLIGQSRLAYIKVKITPEALDLLEIYNPDKDTLYKTFYIRDQI
jgi:hypothetical protein